MYLESEITNRFRPRRPRRTLDHLFGDDEREAISEVVREAIRPRRVTAPVRPDRPDSEFAPYQGAIPVGSFAGDAPVPVARALPPAIRPAYPSQSEFAPNPVDVLGEPPAPIVRDPNAPFGSSGEPFGSARPRRTQPRDYVADAAQYVRDTESQPVERSRTKSAGYGLAQGGVIGALIGAVRPELYGEVKRGRKLTRARERLGEEVAIQNQRTKFTEDMVDIAYKGAQTDYLRVRPDIEANKAAEQQRRTLISLYNRLPEFDPADPTNADLVRAMAEAGLPAVPKSRANQLRFVQDARTGEWQIIAGDRSTGEAIAQSVATPEGTPAVTTPTGQITAETAAANRESRERIADLNRQSREAVSELNRRARASGARGDAREEARLTRAIKEISDLENLKTDAISGPVAGRISALEKAVTKAAEIRSLYGDLVDVGYGGDSEGRQWPYAKMKGAGVQRSGVLGRPPANDGRHHYTVAEIRAQAEAAGVSYESLYNKLKGNRRVAIDE